MPCYLLQDTPPPTFQTLAVSRRQLYAAGARASTSPLAAAAAAVSPQSPSSASSISAAAEAGAAAVQEAEAARAWLCFEQERESGENMGALQSVRASRQAFERRLDLLKLKFVLDLYRFVAALFAFWPIHTELFNSASILNFAETGLPPFLQRNLFCDSG